LAFNPTRRKSQKAHTSKFIVQFIEATLFTVLIFLSSSPLLHAEFSQPHHSLKKMYTIMLYLNGDNSLIHEVLYTIDMLETVGSSDDINILALVDGRPGFKHVYGNSRDGAKLVYITRDPPGSLQIRGIKFEEPLKAIRSNSTSLVCFRHQIETAWLGHYEPSGTQSARCYIQHMSSVLFKYGLFRLAAKRLDN